MSYLARSRLAMHLVPGTWASDHRVAINNDHPHKENHRETGTGDHGVVPVDFAWRPAPA